MSHTDTKEWIQSNLKTDELPDGREVVEFVHPVGERCEVCSTSPEGVVHDTEIREYVAIEELVSRYHDAMIEAESDTQTIPEMSSEAVATAARDEALAEGTGHERFFAEVIQS